MREAGMLADTGYFVGLFNPKDTHHDRCKAFFSGFKGVTITTWAVFAETCALLQTSKQRHFFAWVTKAQSIGHLRIECPPADAVAELWRLMDRYDDLPMDFCDASLVYLAAHLKLRRIATVDLRDYSVYRLPGKPTLHPCAGRMMPTANPLIIATARTRW